MLDVACGTGNASLAIAGFLPAGRVTAVDFSPSMLEKARQKAGSLDVRNIEFMERDMQNLDFQDGLFDVAVCAFGIFFVEEQWWDVVWNGGFRMMVSQLSADGMERFKREHLEEVEVLMTGEGIWLDVGVLFTRGTKSSRE